MSRPAILSLIVFIVGAAIGSFLNVCIYRIPRSKSIVRPGSHCPSCDKAIPFYDNVPLISYLILRGRCRQCRATISPRYFMVELLTALLFVAAYLTFGLTFELLVNVAFVSLLIIISFIDLDFRVIPDTLSIGGVVLGMALSFFRPFYSYKDALFGILVGGGILFSIAIGYQFFAKREGMGGGDIKLLAMIGAFCGIKGVIFTLVFGSLAGTVVGIPLMLIKGEGTKYALPFGPFLSLGALAYVLFGDSLIYGYIHLIGGR